jgi:hypothetical protein
MKTISVLVLCLTLWVVAIAGSVNDPAVGNSAVKTFYGTSTDAANTYTATISGAGTTWPAGTLFAIKFTHHMTSACTLSINSSTAYAMVLATGAAISADQGSDNQISILLWDGTKFIFLISPNNVV